MPDLTGAAANGTKFSRLMKVQFGLCYLCRAPLSRHRIPSEDHVVPKSRMRRNMNRRSANILLACEVCNISKGDRAPHPCEVLFCISIYLRMPGVDAGKGWHKENRFKPLRARLATARPG